MTAGPDPGTRPVVTINSVCDAEGDHDPGLPDRDLRQLVLTAAIAAAEKVLSLHGYGDVARSAEILHVATEDAAEYGYVVTPPSLRRGKTP